MQATLGQTDFEAAAALVHAQMPATAQHTWPQINADVGAQVFIKHENHTPTGAFKIRGGITFVDWLRRTHPEIRAVVTATRGNHGQSLARAATAAGLRSVIYVPHANSVEKNAAMPAFGAEVIEEGADVDVAMLAANRAAETEGLYRVPSFHREIIRGVATYGYELMTAVRDLDTIYVPVGCGSGICSLIAVRDALGLKTRIVGVVSTGADAAKRSFDSGAIVDDGTAKTFADGMAVRVVVPEAFAIYAKGADRIVAVSDDEVADAIRLLFRATHNVAEGAGAAALAAARQERSQIAGQRTAVILCGGNIDTATFIEVMSGRTPRP
jgi:threonine dehydratase